MCFLWERGRSPAGRIGSPRARLKLRVVISDHVLVISETVLVISETVLDELCRVLRDKLGVPRATVEAAEAFLRRQGIVIGQAPSLGIAVRDCDDIAVLEEAVGGQADVLVTGGRDLLEVAGVAPVDIVTPRGFWESLRR